MREFIPWRRDYYAKFDELPKNAKRLPTDKTLQWDMMLGKAIVKWAGEQGLRVRHVRPRDGLRPLEPVQSRDLRCRIGKPHERSTGGLGRTAEARAAFERALASDPSEVTALTALTLADIEQKRTAAARARVDAAAGAAPKNAALQTSAARLYAALGDWGAAERSIRNALAADANSLEAYEVLALVFLKQNRPAEALAEYEKLAERQPKSVSHPTAIGMLNEIQNRRDEAKRWYERALTIDPRNAVAANNLANYYLDRGESLDTALQLAQTAKAGLPNSHQVDVTLGWIYYKKGLATQAVICSWPDQLMR